jgi:hypothetical protein
VALQAAQGLDSAHGAPVQLAAHLPGGAAIHRQGLVFALFDGTIDTLIEDPGTGPENSGRLALRGLQ